MNLLITTVCNRKCSFCFAKERLEGKQDTAFMSREMISEIMDMLIKESHKDLRLLGGEPTLHPEFSEIIDAAMERELNILLFSNGMMPDRAVDAIDKYPTERISILCNISPQADDHPSLIKRREAALSKLGPRMVPGFTITSLHEEIDLGMYLEAIEKYGMKRQVRVGIAQPIVDRDNDHIAAEDYPLVGAAVKKMALQCIEQDVLLGFDCGMTPCMFSGDQWETVMTCTKGFESICAPIIDIGPEGDIWHCFPLSGVFNTSLSDFSCRAEMDDYYNRKMEVFRSFGCRPECVRCKFHLRGQCKGGCLAHAIQNANYPGQTEAVV